MWNLLGDDPLCEDGGQNRRLKSKATYPDPDGVRNPTLVREGKGRPWVKSKLSVKTEKKSSIKPKERAIKKRA
jgi:hypothetical protein